MRFMILVKGSRDSEAGTLPDAKLLAEMGRYNEELVKAGVTSTARSPRRRSSSPASGSGR